jgi:hypothetical protein
VLLALRMRSAAVVACFENRLSRNYHSESNMHKEDTQAANKLEQSCSL